jgi:hypothetical protein
MRRSHAQVQRLESRRLLAATPVRVLFDSGGFESPRYAAGPLENQDVAGPWLKTTQRAGVAAVQSQAVAAGAQAVRLTRPAALDGDTRYGVVKPFAPTAAADVLRVRWDMNVTRNEQPGVRYGPFLGAEAYDTVNGVPLLIGSLGVDATTGQILYQDGNSGALAETGASVGFGEWNHFVLEIDYAADTYTVFVNGDAKATTGFVADAAAGFSDAPIAALAASIDTVAAATGTAHIDNYAIEAFADPTPPEVTNVYVAGSAWAPAFKRLMEGRGFGHAAHGYAVAAGPDQLDALPWTNVDRITLTFNRDVRVDRNDLSVRGVNVADYPVSGFTYNPATKTATWTLGRPLGRDRVTLTLDADAGDPAGGVTARDGATRLDGEWADGAHSFPSGDGSPGGDFTFGFNVAPGDATRDGRLSAYDVLQVRARQAVPAPSDPRARLRTGYTVFHDLNGDGRINAVDVALARRRQAGAPASSVIA